MTPKQLIASATTAAVLATGGVSIAGAVNGSGSSPARSGTAVAPTAATSAPSVAPTARHPRVRRLLRHAVVIAARTIGITPAQLRDEVRSGKTIGEVAQAHGVAPDTVVNALVDAATKRIEAARAAGRISAARATKLEGRVRERATKFVTSWHPRHRDPASA